MKIAKLTIKNFRSFGPEGVEINLAGDNHKLSAFIGLNSSGKTTALEALRKLFGTTAADRDIVREDFHIAEGENPEEKGERELSIEVKLIFDDEEKEAVPDYFNHMVVGEEGEDPYVRIRLEAIWQKSHTVQGDIDARLFYIKVAEGEEEDDDSKQPCPNHQRSLIEVFYVPAIRRPSEQIKYASGSILYRVLRQMNMDEAFTEKFDENIQSINDLFKGLREFASLQGSLNSFWEKFHKDERYREANLSFSGNDTDSILKKLEVFFSPTGTHRKFGVNDLGEGYRSLFYLTLVCCLLEFENKLRAEESDSDQQRPLLTVLAIEEPENHIAPQLLGRVIKILLGIAHQANAQVLLSSHTPAIIKRLHPESIYHFRINEDYQTEVARVTLPDDGDAAYKYLQEAVQNYPEIYFSRLVIIGEGDSEEVIFNRLMQVFSKDFDDNLITFVPLGHRFVNHVWKLLDDLHIPYITLLDLDLEREGGGWGRIKYVISQLLELGYEKEELLKLEDGNMLTDEAFLQMHKWAVDKEHLSGWVTFLETYNVFFSAPLDIDFLLLKHFPDQYKALVPIAGGPRIPDRAAKPDEFTAKVNTAVTATLKSEEAKGITYSDEDKELMIWYNYHFLARGKPATHIAVLAELANEQLEEEMPELFTKIFNRIEQKLTPAHEVHENGGMAAR